MAEQRTGTRFERFMGWLGGEGDDSAFAAANIAASGAPIAGVVGTPAHSDAIGLPGATQAASGVDPEKEALLAEVARLRQAEATRAQEAIAVNATAFADAEIAASRAVPAEREALIAAFTEAAADDAAHPRAEGQASRVAGLQARQAARPAHTLTTELLPVRAGDDGHLTLLDSARETRQEGDPAPLTAERWREQRAFTATGRGILAQHGIPVSGPLGAEHRATIATLAREKGLEIAG